MKLKLDFISAVITVNILLDLQLTSQPQNAQTAESLAGRVHQKQTSVLYLTGGGGGGCLGGVNIIE